MAALPGLTSTSLTKEWTKDRVSVSSLALRNSLISSAKVAMTSAESSITRRSASSALASSAATSSFSLRSLCSLMRSEASAILMSVVSMTCHMRPSFLFTSSSSSSMLSSFCRCSRATPSISSSSSFTRSRMLDSVRMFSLISPTMRFSKFLALSLGVLQVPLPRFSREWQT